MNIKTERLIIRPFRMEDILEAHSLFVLNEVMKPVGMAPAINKIEDSRDRIFSWIENGNYYAIVLRETGRVIGFIVIKPDSEEGREDTRELGFALNPKYQHKSYMTETVKAVVNYLRNEAVCFVWACCFKDNLSSKNLIERCGFEFQNSGEYFVENEDFTYQSLEYRMKLF